MTLSDWTFVGQLWCVGAAALLVLWVGAGEYLAAKRREEDDDGC